MTEPAPEAAATSFPTPSTASRVSGALTVTFVWLRDLLLSLLIAILIILFLYRPVKVEGSSMMPTLKNDERLFINEFGYRFGLEQIHRGDTVVFWFPGDPTKSYIKRVIGLPGDTVQIHDGNVFINGKKLNEPYVPRQYRDDGDFSPVTIPPNDYFVLGDHRNASNDSRAWGFVPKSYIYGKAVFVFWPLDDVGTIH